MSLFAVAPFMGPTLGKYPHQLLTNLALTVSSLTSGPVISGFLSTSKLGWRSSFWFMAIFALICFVVNLFFVPETYAPVLLRKRAKKLGKETGLHYISALDHGKPIQNVKQRFRTSIFRPFVLLFTESIVFWFAVYMAYL
jgi:MFS family permease